LFDEKPSLLNDALIAVPALAVRAVRDGSVPQRQNGECIVRRSKR
jgi:hypothetical protein